MVDGSHYLAFLVAVTILVLAPGPDMFYIIAAGVRGGSRAGFAAALGVAAGLSVHTAAAALGLSALVTALPPVYHTVRWAGAAYLLYLAVMAFRDRNGLAAPSDEEQPTAGAVRLKARKAFRSAMVVNLLNPKVILFNIAFLPQFVRPESRHVGLQFLVLGVTFVLIDLAIDGTIGLAAGRLSRLRRRGQNLARTLNIFSGSIFAVLAVRLLIPGE